MKFPRIAEAVGKIVDENGGNKAAAARLLQTNATSISHWLSGERYPSSPESIAVIAKHSGKSIDWLMFGKNVIPSPVDLSVLNDEEKRVWDLLQTLPPEKRKKAYALLELVLSDD